MRVISTCVHGRKVALQSFWSARSRHLRPNRWVLLVGVVLWSLFGAAPTRAQVVVHAGGGVSLARSPDPIADAPLDAEASGGVGTFIGPFLTVRAVVDYSRFNPDAPTVRESLRLIEGAVSGGGGHALALLVDLKLNSPLLGSLSPYLAVGLGGVRLVEQDAVVTVEGTDPVRLEGTTYTGPAASVAAGLNLVATARVALFMEARYLTGVGSADGVAYVPIRLGLAVR